MVRVAGVARGVGINGFFYNHVDYLKPVESLFWTFRSFMFPLRVRGGKPVSVVPFLVAVFFLHRERSTTDVDVLL